MCCLSTLTLQQNSDGGAASSYHCNICFFQLTMSLEQHSLNLWQKYALDFMHGCGEETQSLSGFTWESLPTSLSGTHMYYDGPGIREYWGGDTGLAWEEGKDQGGL